MLTKALPSLLLACLCVNPLLAQLETFDTLENAFQGVPSVPLEYAVTAGLDYPTTAGSLDSAAWIRFFANGDVTQATATENAPGLSTYLQQEVPALQNVPTLQSAPAPIVAAPDEASAIAASDAGSYRTADMVGPLTSGSSLFSQLKIDQDFRTQPLQSASRIRIHPEQGHQPGLKCFAWSSPHFYHRALYFEQVNLERYGIGAPRYLQPFYSAAHFYGSIGILPYKTLVEHPNERSFTLGHQRPGDYVAYQRRAFLGTAPAANALHWAH